MASFSRAGHLAKGTAIDPALRGVGLCGMHLLEAKGLFSFVCSQDVTSSVLHTDIMADLKMGGVLLKGILTAAVVEYSAKSVHPL